MLHFCGEIRLNHWYRCAAEWHTEPVIQHDLRAHRARRGAPRRRVPALHAARDRARRRRGQARVREDRRADGERRPRRQAAAPDQPAREQASSFRNDTVQSRLPDPSWLRALARRADPVRRGVGEARRRHDPHNLSALFGQTFETVAAAQPLPQVARRARSRRRLTAPAATGEPADAERAGYHSRMWTALALSLAYGSIFGSMRAWAAQPRGGRRGAVAVRRSRCRSSTSRALRVRAGLVRDRAAASRAERPADVALGAPAARCGCSCERVRRRSPAVGAADDRSTAG